MSILSKKRISVFILAIVSCAVINCAFLIPAYADTVAPNKEQQCATILTPFCSDDPQALFDLIKMLINIFTAGIGVLATVGVVWFGYQIMTANSDPTKINKAKRHIIEIVIGVVAWVLGMSLLNLLLPNLTGTLDNPDVEISQDDIPDYPEPEIKKKSTKKETKKKTDEKEEKKESKPASSVTIEVKHYQPSGYATYYQVTEISAGAVPYVYAPNRGYGMSQATVIGNLKKTKALVAINAGTFNTSSGANNRGSGIVITKGSNKLANSSQRPSLVFDKNGTRPGWAKQGTKANNLISGSAEYYNINGKKTKGAIYSAVSHFAPIIIGGKVANGKQSSFDYSNMHSHYSQRRARQIFCAKDNGGKIKYAIITNKNESTGGGWDFDQMSKTAKSLGCTFAFNLDGGGSTSTYTRKKASGSFTHYGYSGRSVPTYIIFTADNKPL